MAYMTDQPEETGGTGFDPAIVMRAGAAAVSLGLLVGMGVWGYKLAVRDANGIPVVQAMEGPMRETPADPGGEVAVNTGLAVNDVAAEGGAAEPEDVVLLAPQTAGLTEEDLLVQPTAEAGEVTAADVVAEVTVQGTGTEVHLGGVAVQPDVEVAAEAPMTAEQILALADEISEGVEALEVLSEEVVPPELSVAGAVVPAEPAVERISADIPGVTRAFRPPARPAQLVQAAAVVETTESTIPEVPSVDVSIIDVVLSQAQNTEVAATVTPAVAGNTLVQLGTFGSSDEARSRWQTLGAEFVDFMSGKELVIQEATSGGRQFFRLRATGFSDINDSRRFCATLQSEDTACIPVVFQ